MSCSLSAVVVAAGRARRFQESSGIDTNKVLCDFEGVPLIRRTLEALFQLPLSQVCLVVRAEERPAFERALGGLPQLDRISYALGGLRRQDSVRQGLGALKETTHVLVHDGARPFISREFLDRLWRAAQYAPALIPVQPVTETLKEIAPDGSVVRTMNRSSFVRVQTPQFFEFELLRDVHHELRHSDQEFTDDAAMLESLGHRVETAAGHSQNIKVTFAEDLRGLSHAR